VPPDGFAERAGVRSKRRRGVGRNNGSHLDCVVLDQTGSAIPNAEVILSGAKPKATRAVKTDGTGSFSFHGVVTGTYNLRVRYEKFSIYDSNVQVGTEAVPLRIILDLGKLKQQITVTGDAPQVSTETSQNRDSIAIDSKALNSLPVFDQDYVTTVSRFLDPGAIATSGLTVVVDGAEANGPGVSASGIQEVKIN
jgi:Carboxypeptidase regulatory-like domain